jgi:hypothetical protein
MCEGSQDSVIDSIRQFHSGMLEKRRPLRRLPNDHSFGSLLMLSLPRPSHGGAITPGAFLTVTWVARRGLFFFLRSLRFVESDRRILFTGLRRGNSGPAGGAPCLDA